MHPLLHRAGLYIFPGGKIDILGLGFLQGLSIRYLIKSIMAQAVHISLL